jgi:hypothetical protein
MVSEKSNASLQLHIWLIEFSLRLSSSLAVTSVGFFEHGHGSEWEWFEHLQGMQRM